MDASVLLGTTIADTYEIEQKLGAGGMGTVFVARNIRLGKRYALKVLNPELAQSYPQAVERFRREAVTAGRLGHVGIAQVHDIAQTDDGIAYMVMDLLDGEDLETRMAETGLLSWDAIYRIITQTCDALATAHEAGIVHRDLKPANIFLSRRQGEGERAVLLDFGVAKVLDAHRSLPDEELEGGKHVPTPTLTKPGTLVGTPNYMSPEQASGLAVDHLADIYSMGAVLFHMATSEPPFNAESLLAVLTMIAIDPVPLIHDVTPAANRPKDLDKVVSRAMAKNPRDRYQDIRELARALPPPEDAGRISVAAASRDDDKDERGPKSADDEGKTAAGTPLPRTVSEQRKTVDTLHDGVAAKTRLDEPSSPPPSSEPQPKRSSKLSWALIGIFLVVGIILGAIAALSPGLGGDGGSEPVDDPPTEPPPSQETLFSRGMSELQQEIEQENWASAAGILTRLSRQFSSREAVLRPMREQIEMEMESAALHRRAKAQVGSDRSSARQVCVQIQVRSVYRDRPPCQELLQTAEEPDAGAPDADPDEGPRKVARPTPRPRGRTGRDIDRIYRRNRGRGRRCFERAFEGGFQPMGTIRVSVRAVIGSSGSVTNASLLDPRYRSNAALKVCLENLVRSWEFPPSTGSTTREFLFTYQARNLDLEGLEK